jgi:ATP-dependent Lon protease
MVGIRQDESQYSVYSYALLQAAAQSDLEAVSGCLDHGAYVEATDALGRTPIILASGQCYPNTGKIVGLLLAHNANPAHHDNHNETACHAAAAAGNDQVLHILKAAGAPMDACSLDLNTPAHLAKNARCTSVLLSSGARVYLENKAGNLPIMEAVLRGDIESVELQLQYGAKPLRRNKAGVNAISMAWDLKQSAVMLLFYRYSQGPGLTALSFDTNSSDFGVWLTGALRNTPSDLGVRQQPGVQVVSGPGPVSAAAGVQLSADETMLPYFDMAELERALKMPMDEDRPKYLEQMKSRGEMRVLKRVPDSFDFSELRENFPNFDKVSNFLEQQIDLCRLAPNKVAAFQPMLLLGDPGVGKTRYLLEVSALLNLEFSLIQCGGVSANFVLSGSTTSWKNGKPGKIHTVLRDGRTINPVIMLDEVDKLNGSSDYDAHGPLYQLLEKKTAKSFQDECIEVPMDCTHVIWVSTANHLHMIPDAIVSRLVVIDVPAPEGEGLIRVAKSIYRDILAEFADTWGGRFTSALAEEVLEQVRSSTPREIRKQFLAACGNAAMRHARQGNSGGLVEITVPDLGCLPSSQHGRRPGFHQS